MKRESLNWLRTINAAALFGTAMVLAYVGMHAFVGGTAMPADFPAEIKQRHVEFPEMALGKQQRERAEGVIDANPQWREIFRNPQGRARRAIVLGVHYPGDGPVSFVSGVIAQAGTTHQAKRLATGRCEDHADERGLPVICFVVWSNGKWVGQ